MYNGLLWNLLKSMSDWIHHCLRSFSALTAHCGPSIYRAIKDIWLLFFFFAWTACMLFHRIQHQNIRLSRDTRPFWHAFRLLWKLMKRSPRPTVQTTQWRISMGFRAHHRLLCLFVITGNGTEEYRQVFTTGWFLTQKWCNSSPIRKQKLWGLMLLSRCVLCVPFRAKAAVIWEEIAITWL